MRTQFLKDAITFQQKGRKVSIQSQKRVNKDLTKLIDQKYIIKLNKFSEKLFINPIVIKLSEQMVKLALKTKEVNMNLHVKKYQMPNIEQTLFSTLDLRFAYSQIPLNQPSKKQCSFCLIGDHAIWSYQLQTGLYGLTDMPAEFQKTVDLTLLNGKKHTPT